MRLCFAICMLSLAGVVLGEVDQEARIVCYYGSWATERSGIGRYSISDIDPKMCTHLIMAFADLNDCGGIEFDDKTDEIEKFVALKELSPETKFLISIGGWENSSPKYSSIIGSPELRRTFVQSLLGFILQNGFDGVDFYWAYPEQKDKENFVDLLRELRTIFDKTGYVLTASLLAVEGPAKNAYNIAGVGKYVDFIDLLGFEYHGDWDTVTGHNAPLVQSERDRTPYEQTLNIQASVDFWLAQGIPAKKLNLGLPFYGKSFTLADPAKNTPGSPITGIGAPGVYTQTPGDLAYFEICQNLVKNGWTNVWDNDQHEPYAYGGDQWVSFDSAWSIPWKTDLVKRNGLGGVMIWNIDMDDFIGACGPKNALLKAVNRELRPELGIKWD